MKKINVGKKYDVHYYEALIKAIITNPKKNGVKYILFALRVMIANAYQKWVSYKELVLWINPETGETINVLKHKTIAGHFERFVDLGYFEKQKMKGCNHYRSTMKVVTEDDAMNVAMLKNLCHNRNKYENLIEKFNADYFGTKIVEPKVQQIPVVPEVRQVPDLDYMNDFNQVEKSIDEKILNLSLLSEESRRDGKELINEIIRNKSEFEKLLNSERAVKLIEACDFIKEFMEIVETYSNKKATESLYEKLSALRINE